MPEGGLPVEQAPVRQETFYVKSPGGAIEKITDVKVLNQRLAYPGFQQTTAAEWEKQIEPKQAVIAKIYGGPQEPAKT